MNTQDQSVPRLFRLNPPWSKQFWQHLRQEADILDVIPNEEGRRFSVWMAEHIIAEPALNLIKKLGLDLSIVRNFRLDARSRNATMLHRDHPSNPCFAVNICIRGSLKAHFYPDTCAALFNQKTATQNNPVFYSSGEPSETYTISEGELFVMDTSAIHQADTSECHTSVLLASFVPKPQYRYETALQRLGLA